jgi:hypothetical protein
MDLTDLQWTIIEPLFEEKRGLTAAAARGATLVRCSTGCCGSCAPARRGMTCRIATRRTRPAIGGSSSGGRTASLEEDLRLRGKMANSLHLNVAPPPGLAASPGVWCRVSWQALGNEE